MMKLTNGQIKKGNMEKGELQGTWEFYFPADEEGPGYWCKQDYVNDLEVSEEYDIRYDDGFYKSI